MGDIKEPIVARETLTQINEAILQYVQELPGKSTMDLFDSISSDELEKGVVVGDKDIFMEGLNILERFGFVKKVNPKKNFTCWFYYDYEIPVEMLTKTKPEKAQKEPKEPKVKKEKTPKEPKVKAPKIADDVRVWFESKTNEFLASDTLTKICEIYNSENEKKCGVGQFRVLLLEEAEKRKFEIYKKPAQEKPIKKEKAETKKEETPNAPEAESTQEDSQRDERAA